MDTKLKGDLAEQATVLQTLKQGWGSGGLGAIDFLRARCLDELEIFHVFPAAVFMRYGSEIHLVETEQRQHKPRSVTEQTQWD